MEDQELFITAEMVVKAAGDWELDVLAMPFGGPSDKDSDGQWFTDKTQTFKESLATIPVMYYHAMQPDGKRQSQPEQIGVAKYDHTDASGHWYKVALDKAKALAQRIWNAAKDGIARASSGSINHLVRIAANGEILSWPLAELSLIDAEGKRQPANPHAVAMPVMKTVYDQAGLTLPETIQPDGEQPEASGRGDEQPGAEPNPNGIQKTRGNKMELEELTKLLDERDARKADALKAEADKQAAIKAEVEAQVAAKEAEFAKKLAEMRRLPGGMARTTEYAATGKYDHLSAAELGLMIDTQEGIHEKEPRKMAAVSPDAIKALMLKVARIEQDKVSPDSENYAKSALKAAIGGELTDEAIKAVTDPMYSTLSTAGSQWVGTAYSNQIWEAIRAQAKIVGRIPSVVIPDGYSSEYFPVESTDPTWYKVAETTASDSTMGFPVASVTASQLTTANKQITVGKMGARVQYTGELTEDSLVNFVPQLRMQLEKSGAEMMEYVVVDGDTATSSNINDIGGTTYSGAATSLFLLTNGFRKSPLVTTTTQSRSASGGFVAEDYLETLKLLGSNGLGFSDPSKCGLIVDPNVWFASAKLPEAKDKNQTIFTVDGGFVTRAYLVEIIPSWFMHKNSTARKANTAGKVDQDTVGNNAYGAIVGVRFDQWKLGYKRRMTMETSRFPKSDSWEIVALTRWGMVQRDTLASSETYYVGV